MSDKRYVLGVDGGGTKTDAFLFDTDGRRVAHVRGGATNHETYEGGFEEMKPVFAQIVADVCAEAGVAPPDLAGTVCGLSGIDVTSQKLRMDRFMDELGFRNYRIINDSFLGVKAACPKGYGVSFVNGTGNSVGGIDRRGDWLQVGGTGLHFGDLNGASGMSGKVILAVFSMFYRCGEPTSMADKFFRLLGIGGPAEFVEAVYDQVYTEKVTNKDIADEVLYPAVNEGDPVAVRTLCEIAEQFSLGIAGCINNLDFGDEVDVVLIGSATLKAGSPLLVDTIRKRVSELTGKKISTIPMTVPPACGALLWAMELAGTEITPALREKVLSELKR
ncbi:MAG: hypothetical protein IJL69_07330 [Oscillospiraceae bacterium]|nr:hypothetical protein [Oscillospiraceae bacterium]